MANTSELTLYRKYRPRAFAEVLNQEVVKQTIQNAIRLGRISHAYLFAGPRGTGKTTIARLLAKSLNCQHRKDGESEPCNECEMCVEMNAGRALDLIEIDAASNRGIDEIRELRDGIKFAPVKGKYKVFIIDEAHMLTTPAFNAFLKTLEEPPEHAIFVLATTEAEKLPPTILSRVQRFDFRRITVSDIIKKLASDVKSEGLHVEPDALRLIASVAEGSIRDAESLLAQVVAFEEGDTISLSDVEEVLGTINFAKLKDWLELLSRSDAAGAISFLNQAHDDGYDPAEFTHMTVSALRKVMVLQVDPALEKLFSRELPDEELQALKGFAKSFHPAKVRELVKGFMNAQYLIRRAVIPTLPIELVILETFVGDASAQENK